MEWHVGQKVWFARERFDTEYIREMTVARVNTASIKTDDGSKWFACNGYRYNRSKSISEKIVPSTPEITQVAKVQAKERSLEAIRRKLSSGLPRNATLEDLKLRFCNARTCSPNTLWNLGRTGRDPAQRP